MKKYYYVGVENAKDRMDKNWEVVETQLSKRLDKLLKKVMVDGKEQYAFNYPAKKPLLLVCQKEDNYCINPVSGEKYKWALAGSYSKSITPELILHTKGEINVSQVADIIRCCGPEVYYNLFKELEEAVAISYEEEMELIEGKEPFNEDEQYLKNIQEEFILKRQNNKH